MKNTTQAYSIIPIFLITLATLTSGRTAEPSLAETTAWLTDRLPSLVLGDDGDFSVTSTIQYAFTGCILHVREKQISTASPDHQAETTAFYVVQMQPLPGKLFEPREGTFEPLPAKSLMDGLSSISNDSINFRNIDLSSIKVKTVHLGTSQLHGANFLAMYAPKEVLIATTDEQLAHQVTRALARAASLCGASGSPF